MSILRLCGVLDISSSRASGLIAGVGILATLFFLTTAPAAIFTAFASTIAARSAAFVAYTISATSDVFAASAVAAMFFISLKSVRFLLTAGDLEFAALQGRVSCAEKKGALDGSFIVAAVGVGGQNRFASGGRNLDFQPLALVYHSTFDPFPHEPVRRAL